ncbi:MAG: LysM peptidoglycan-binding domain-containing protein [Puniceicoccales bacterium]|nr:LysM peptidoglycan-binding domain-containing protein [Puniceicoccales bacterium]
MKTIIIVGCLVMISGCGQSGVELTPEEIDDNKFIAGQRLLREGRAVDAIDKFLAVIDSRKNAPRSHLEAGKIYLEKYDDPVLAIYHFRQFLLKSSSTLEDNLVTQMIETAQKRFVQKLLGNDADGYNNQNFLVLLKRLREENISLKRQLDELRKLKNINEKEIYFAENRQLQSSLNSYTVTAGDTLSSISQKIYGSSEKWKVIFAANSDKLNTPDSLKVGQILVIPRD